MSHPELDELIAYWLGDADDVEEHYFGCAQCAGRLEWLAALSDGVRAAVRAGAFGMVIPSPFVEAMKRAGMRLREYHTDAGAPPVNCTFRADEDAVVSHVRAPLAGVKRVDMLQRLEMGGVEREFRLEDVPFDPASGEVVFLPPVASLKQKHRVRVSLLAVGEQGETRLGEYTFDHTPAEMP